MSSFWGDILIHSAFFLGFLILFYFTFVIYVQQNALASDVANLVKDPIQSARVSGNSEITAEIKAILAQIKPFPMSDEQKTRNATVVKWLSVAAGILGPSMLILGIWLEIRAYADLYAVFTEMFISMAFIVVSEFAIVGIFLANMTELNKDTMEAILYEGANAPGVLYAHCDFVDQFMKSRFPAFF